MSRATICCAAAKQIVAMAHDAEDSDTDMNVQRGQSYTFAEAAQANVNNDSPLSSNAARTREI